MNPLAGEDSNPSAAATALRELFAATPGRVANTVRAVVLILLTVTICETFRIPEAAIAAYIVLFVFKTNRHATVLTASVAGLAVLAGVLLTVAAFMASLSEPALRLPLIAALTFAAMFASRASPLGPALFPAGFIIAYGLTLGDQVLGLSLESATVSNTTAPGLPNLVFIPPEEALLHFLLWLMAAVALPVALVLLTNLSRPVAEPAEAQGRPKPRLLRPDAFTDPAHYQFALKTTLAVLLCYAAESLTDWPGIHTCMITCFFVSLSTVEATLHKAALRITGCLAGGGLAIAAILVLMPVMQDVTDLLLLLAPVSFVAAWIGFGSDRFAYAGLQLALAFYLGILQGFGPSLDMETARDRMIGILLGNLVVTVIFTSLWPVRAPGLQDRRPAAPALDPVRVGR